MVHLRVLIASLLVGGVAAGQQMGRAHKLPKLEARIAAVESGLAPPVEVTGRPAERRNLAAEMRRLHVPAVSIAVIHGGKVEWAKGYGQARETGGPVTPETLFQAASISKSLTAMAALKLVEEGKLSLDAPINTALKSWKLPENKLTKGHLVTLRQLLSHTAGTTVHGFPGYAAGAPVPTLTQVLDGAKPANTPAVVVEAQPGAGFSYSGGGYTVVQQAMIDVTGQLFPDLLKTLVLDPLKMAHSGYLQPLLPSLMNKAALPVDGSGKPIAGGPHTYPEMAAAGLWTTPSDLAKWVIEMQGAAGSGSGKAKGKHVLSVASTRVMLTAGTEGYGLGVGVAKTDGRASFSHSGGNEGYRCRYFSYEDGDGAVVMTNSDNGGALYQEVLASVAREYGWTDFKPEQRTAAATAPPVAELLQFAGKFKAQSGLYLELTASSKGLAVSIEGQPAETLVAASGNSFFSTESLLQMTFETPDKGTFAPGFSPKAEFVRVNVPAVEKETP